MYDMKKYKLKGALMNGVFETVLGLILIGTVGTVLSVFGGALSGQVYNTAQTQISGITNSTIKGSVESAILASFQAQEQNAEFQPLLYLALIMGVVIAVILGSVRVATGGNVGGSAL